MCNIFKRIVAIALFIQRSLQINIAFSNPLSKFDYVQQFCTDIPLHICCVPMDVMVPEKGHGWFSAERIVISGIPRRHMFASAWKYQKGTRQTACNGVMAGGRRTEGDEKWSYYYVPSQDWPGLSGGWIVEWGSGPVENDTLTTAPRGVAFPDIIKYLGDNYTDGGRGNGVYRNPYGGILRAIPLWRECHF